MNTSAPPTCPKSALSPLPLIRPRTTLSLTTLIRDENLYASGVPGHQPSMMVGAGVGLAFETGGASLAFGSSTLIGAGMAGLNVAGNKDFSWGAWGGHTAVGAL